MKLFPPGHVHSLWKMWRVFGPPGVSWSLVRARRAGVPRLRWQGRRGGMRIDTWVRGVIATHFAGSAVRVGPRARRITIEVCRSEKPISEGAGYRRQTFLVEGQQVLVWHSSSEQGMNDFAVGALASGPNVFLN